MTEIDPLLAELLIVRHELQKSARACVRELRGTPWLIYAITTGARGDLGKLLWQPAGASQNVLSDRFSYAQQETVELLGFEPEKFVSRETACFMATAAFYQGRKLAVKRGLLEDHVMGIGMTAAVTTGRERRGADQVMIAIRTHAGLWTVEVVLKKPDHFEEEAEEYRIAQGEFADLLTLNAILATAGVRQVPLAMDRVERSAEMRGDGMLVPTRVPLAADDGSGRPVYGRVIMPDGTLVEIASLDPKEWILFPGSFDPITYAHDEMARALQRATGKKVLFQITRAHPTKIVTDEDMLRRSKQFRYRWPVVLLEDRGLYVEKAELFRRFEMLVGADVVESLFDQRYYGGYEEMMAAMDRLQGYGTVFHVNGRICRDGRYKELGKVSMPSVFAPMFRAFSHRNDVSSSNRRAAGATV